MKYRQIFNLAVVKVDAKLPNLILHQIFQLYGILGHMLLTTFSNTYIYTRPVVYMSRKQCIRIVGMVNGHGYNGQQKYTIYECVGHATRF